MLKTSAFLTLLAIIATSQAGKKTERPSCRPLTSQGMTCLVPYFGLNLTKFQELGEAIQKPTEMLTWTNETLDAWDTQLQKSCRTVHSVSDCTERSNGQRRWWRCYLDEHLVGMASWMISEENQKLLRFDPSKMKSNFETFLDVCDAGGRGEFKPQFFCAREAILKPNSTVYREQLIEADLKMQQLCWNFSCEVVSTYLHSFMYPVSKHCNYSVVVEPLFNVLSSALNLLLMNDYDFYCSSEEFPRNISQYIDQAPEISPAFVMKRLPSRFKCLTNGTLMENVTTTESVNITDVETLSNSTTSQPLNATTLTVTPTVNVTMNNATTTVNTTMSSIGSTSTELTSNSTTLTTSLASNVTTAFNTSTEPTSLDSNATTALNASTTSKLPVNNTDTTSVFNTSSVFTTTIYENATSGQPNVTMTTVTSKESGATSSHSERRLTVWIFTVAIIILS